jgi:hypothetical protein
MPRALLLLLLAACDGFSDPESTGLRITPEPGDWIGPIDLIITNATGEALFCEVNEDADCPSVFDDATALAAMAPGDTWRADEVTCTNVDIACLFEGATEADLPIRAWAWFVEPPIEE